MKLFAISDIHIDHHENREALNNIPFCPQDWLILAGDLADTLAGVEYTFQTLSPRFAKLFWVPGNHELWSLPKDKEAGEGVEKYKNLVTLCKKYGVLTPEDPFEVIQTENGPLIIAPLFLLYDYSFCPTDISTVEEAIKWAEAAKIMCNDEYLLKTNPHQNIKEWCEERVVFTEKKLNEAQKQNPTGKFILINHFPFRYIDVTLWLIPRFSIWCGTKKTENWPWKYPTDTVIYGHLHVRRSFTEDGVKFKEVSLGYPKHWNQEKGITQYIQTIVETKKEN